MVVRLKSGRNKIELDLVNLDYRSLNVKDIPLNINESVFTERLHDYFTNVSFEGKKVLIVIADKTRLCEYDNYLPLLESFLLSEGSIKITFAIAYGTHKRQTDEESVAAYGKIYNKYPILHHDCSDEGSLVEIGTTKRGNKVKINKVLFENDEIITFGAISHHYFAGFGGGRKFFCPGLAAKETVYFNHAMFLDKEEKNLHKNCRPGNLKDNPIAEDLKEIDTMLPPKHSIHGLLDANGKVKDIRFGSSYEDFEQICQYYDDHYKVIQKEQYDLVIASCGGYPKDINYIQSHKGVHNSAAFVKDKGKLIVFAECRDGIGSATFMPYIEMGHTKAFEVLSENYEGNGGTALATLEKSHRIDIFMVTNLSEVECRAMGITKIEIAEAQRIISEEKGIAAIIENASMVVKG